MSDDQNEGQKQKLKNKLSRRCLVNVGIVQML